MGSQFFKFLLVFTYACMCLSEGVLMATPMTAIVPWRRYWPTVKRIVQWQIRMSAAFSVPQGLQTTYDILGFPAYQISACE